jgi:GT2 family glycosyltransferase
MKMVTIFILNWNRKNETCRAIASALNQTYSNIEILVVDNGSTDGSAELIKSIYPKIRYVQLDKNYGCPGGRNKGISHCYGEYIFFCDNDGVLHKNAIENAVKCIVLDEKIAIVTGLVKEFNYESEIDTSCILMKKEITDTNLFQGGVSIHRKSLYSIIGFYPDDYMYGGEETYLSYKIIDAGYNIKRCDNIILFHKKSEFARSHSKELIQKWGNALMNAFQLYPIEWFVVYLCYFLTVYPFYAIRNGCFKEYIGNFLLIIKRFRDYKRKPVKRSTYKKIRKYI